LSGLCINYYNNSIEDLSERRKSKSSDKKAIQIILMETKVEKYRNQCINTIRNVLQETMEAHPTENAIIIKFWTKSEENGMEKGSSKT
jgi:hypothetical protein